MLLIPISWAVPATLPIAASIAASVGRVWVRFLHDAASLHDTFQRKWLKHDRFRVPNCPPVVACCPQTRCERHLHPRGPRPGPSGLGTARLHFPSEPFLSLLRPPSSSCQSFPRSAFPPTAVVSPPPRPLYSSERDMSSRLHVRGDIESRNVNDAISTSSLSSMLAATIVPPVVFSFCLLFFFFLLSWHRRWILKRIPRTPPDVEAKHAQPDVDEPNKEAPPDSATPFPAAGDGGVVVTICPPLSATTIDTATPTSSKMPASPASPTSHVLSPQRLAASASTAAAAAAPDGSPISPTRTSSSHSSRLRASVTSLVNRISNVRPSSAGSGSGHGGNRRRRRSRADPVLPRAAQFHFNSNDMMAPRRPRPPPRPPLPPTSFASTAPRRGTVTSPVAVPLLNSPPPRSPLPPTPTPVLVLEPAPPPPPVPPRRGRETVGKIFGVRPLPPLPLFSSHTHSPSLSQSQSQTSPVSSPQSLLSPLSFTSALLPQPQPRHQPQPPPLIRPTPVQAATVTPTALQPNRLRPSQPAPAASFAGQRGHSSDSDPMPPPYRPS